MEANIHNVKKVIISERHNHKDQYAIRTLLVIDVKGQEFELNLFSKDIKDLELKLSKKRHISKYDEVY